MDIIKSGELGILHTKKEMCFIFGDDIIGPFPKTKTMLSMIQKFFKEPEKEHQVLVNKMKVELYMYKSKKIGEAENFYSSKKNEQLTHIANEVLK